MDSLTQVKSLGDTREARWSLMEAIKPLLSCHPRFSETSSVPPVCWLKVMHDHRASKRRHDMPVRSPKAGASIHLLRASVAHKSARAPNS